MTEIFDWMPSEHFGRPSGCNWFYVDIYPVWHTYGWESPTLCWAPVHFTEDF